MSNKTQIATLLADNTTGAITPKDARDALDIVDTEQNLPANVLKSDGSVPMAAGYVPKKDQDVMTKGASFNVAHTGHGYVDNDSVAWSVKDKKWHSVPGAVKEEHTKAYKYKVITAIPQPGKPPVVLADDEIGVFTAPKRPGMPLNGHVVFIVMNKSVMLTDPGLAGAEGAGKFSMVGAGKTASLDILNFAVVGLLAEGPCSSEYPLTFVDGDLVTLHYVVSTLKPDGLVKDKSKGYRLAHEIMTTQNPGAYGISLGVNDYRNPKYTAVSVAKGDNSIVIGAGAITMKDCSIAMGYHTVAFDKNCIAIGKAAKAGDSQSPDNSINISNNDPLPNDPTRATQLYGNVNLGNIFSWKNSDGFKFGKHGHEDLIIRDSHASLPKATIGGIEHDNKAIVTTEYLKSVIPAHPTADGEYKLKVLKGKATWVKI